MFFATIDNKKSSRFLCHSSEHLLSLVFVLG